MIEVGLVGKPNAGKSSFFKAATMVEIEISNRPFTTIDANVGIAYVSFDCVCKELGVKCNPQDGFCMNGIRFAPIKLIDVAGLVPEAHKGKGLGNKFLDDVRKAEALIHVVDFSGKTDEFGNPAENHNPLDDITFLEREIELWFKSIIEKNLGKLMKFKDRDELIDFLLQKLSGLEIERVHLEKALEKTDIDNTEEFAHWLRIFSKPIVIAANKMDLPEAQENFDKLKDELKDRIVIPTSADAEIALKLAAKMKLIEYIPGRTFKIIDEMNEQQRKALNKISDLMKKFGSTGVQTTLDKIIFDVLNYIPVYPVADSHKYSDKKGNVLPNVFLVKKGTKLKEFAGIVHSEMAEKFIAGINAKTKMRLASDYELKPKDVIQIVFGR